MTGAMFTSLNVVSIAVSDFAKTKRSAILRRSGDIFLRVTRPSGAFAKASMALAAGALAALGVTDTEGAACVGVSPDNTPSMSPLVTRPALPVPLTVAGLRPVSAAIRRTAGEISAAAPDLESATGAGALFGATAAGAGVTAAALAGAGAAAAGALPAAPASIVATTCPTVTSVPAATIMRIAPSTSALASEVILSVSNENRAWPFLTAWPSWTSQLASKPPVMDSPIGGILTSTAMKGSDGNCGCPCPTFQRGNLRFFGVYGTQ